MLILLCNDCFINNNNDTFKSNKSSINYVFSLPQISAKELIFIVNDYYNRIKKFLKGSRLQAVKKILKNKNISLKHKITLIHEIVQTYADSVNYDINVVYILISSSSHVVLDYSNFGNRAYVHEGNLKYGGYFSGNIVQLLNELEIIFKSPSVFNVPDIPTKKIFQYTTGLSHIIEPDYFLFCNYYEVNEEENKTRLDYICSLNKKITKNDLFIIIKDYLSRANEYLSYRPWYNADNLNTGTLLEQVQNTHNLIRNHLPDDYDDLILTYLLVDRKKPTMLVDYSKFISEYSVDYERLKFEKPMNIIQLLSYLLSYPIDVIGKISEY